MSERITSVRLPDLHMGRGWSEQGRQTREHMIAEIRKRAEYDLAAAQRILAADDSEFIVETYLGVHVQRKVERVE